MTDQEVLSVSSAILKKVKQLGVHLAGFANVEDLKLLPSFVFASQSPNIDQPMETVEGEMVALNPGELKWPETVKSILVVAMEHPEHKPELDWWHGQASPPGNKLLINAVQTLCEWIQTNFDIQVFHFPYFPERGGIFLKDVAVMAGLGCIGKSNMLVTPEFGPRVRLRSMALDVSVPPTGPSGFDPCTLCDDLCRRACPQNVFDGVAYSSATCNLDILPGRDGCFARQSCYAQMHKNVDKANKQVPEGFSKSMKIVKYCRNCEWSCPVGK